ncbi:glycosyltransferase [Piscinibacter sp.]|uniref:glycosyltransferase n=1 Tax=Piscinibacter sp. TaxID=1903157 RepID=UPI0025F9E02E|nr:glycosyltransferase [Piscinibacter sp.]
MEIPVGQTTSGPHVRVLLATFNGAPWLDEQLHSIFAQQGVRISVVASDDSSSDGTPELLQAWIGRGALTVLPSTGARFGSAHRNFLRLIRDTELGDAAFFALSDQDDIWLPQKLSRGIECLGKLSAQGYSSNVTAFWPDGTRHLIDKAQPQRRFDQLFGSPGPGCTFVFPRSVFQQLQQWVTQNFDRIQGIWVHDWLIYAFVRCRGMRWYIDDQPNMLYRQHGRNEIGVNAGWRAALSRLRHVRTGAYRRDILAIADSVGETAGVVQLVRRLSVLDRLRLVLQVRHFRRRLIDCVILAFFIMVMPRERG